MGAVQPGVVVLVRFPFSDLSASKLRPAIVLAHAGGVDWILCQVTSNPYGRSRSRRCHSRRVVWGARVSRGPGNSSRQASPSSYGSLAS